MRAAALLALAAAIGCTSAAGPGEDRFELVSVNGVALPGAYPDPQGCCAHLEVMTGSLTLEPEGVLQLVLDVRCRANLPPGTSCQVTGNGRERTTGTYSRTGGFVELEGGARYPATFMAERVLIDVGVPPSGGYSLPRFLLEYRSG